MDKKNFLKCSLVIKRIPSWINKTTRVKVRLMDEREVVHASMTGLSVFRDSIYERKQKHKKRRVKNRIREKHELSIRHITYMKKKISKIELKKNSEDVNIFSGYKSPKSSSTDVDPDYIASDTDYSCSDSDDTANCIRTKKFFKRISTTSNSRCQNDSSSSSEDSGRPLQRRELKHFLKRKKIIRGKEINNKFRTLAPVVKKYETMEEMTARHKRMMIDAQKVFDSVLQNIKAEEQLMELQLSAYEKYKTQNSESSEVSVNAGGKQYLCPLYICSVFSTSPEKHLLEVHKDITADEERDIYLKAVKNVKRILPSCQL